MREDLFDLEAYLQNKKQSIESALEGLWMESPLQTAPLVQAMRYSLEAGGKRLRPILCLAACEAVGGSEEDAMPAACGIELIHTYSLIHDDLPAMDDDDLRRGRPTCHKQFGEATAILAGDALLSLAFEVLATRVEPGWVAAACCAALAEAAGACHLVGGQADDVLGNVDDADLETLESVHRRKTGALIVVSLRMGAMVAGARPDQIAALVVYGQCLGLAFQITDDLLDVRGDEKAVGKRVRKDSRHGKTAFPALLGIDRSTERAGQLIDEACEAIVPFGARAGGLEALARYVLERNR